MTPATALDLRFCFGDQHHGVYRRNGTAALSPGQLRARDEAWDEVVGGDYATTAQVHEVKQALEIRNGTRHHTAIKASLDAALRPHNDGTCTCAVNKLHEFDVRAVAALTEYTEPGDGWVVIRPAGDRILTRGNNFLPGWVGGGTLAREPHTAQMGVEFDPATGHGELNVENFTMRFYLLRHPHALDLLATVWQESDVTSLLEANRSELNMLYELLNSQALVPDASDRMVYAAQAEVSWLLPLVHDLHEGASPSKIEHIRALLPTWRLSLRDLLESIDQATM
jgi:hypothetical protein